MMDTGITTEDVESNRLLSVTEEWKVTSKAAGEIAHGAAVRAISRCIDIAEIRCNGAYDFTLDVSLPHWDRLTVKVDVTRAVYRLDMDGRC